MVILAVLATSGCCALLCHTFWRRYFLASACAAVATTVAFQVASYFQLGYVDPFILISSVVVGSMASAMSLAVGLPFLVVRRRRPAIPQHAVDRGFDPVVGEATTRSHPEVE